MDVCRIRQIVSHPNLGISFCPDFFDADFTCPHHLSELVFDIALGGAACF